MKRTGMLLLLACCATLYSYGQQSTEEVNGAKITNESCGSACTCGQGAQTPLGVTTDHIHNKGEWMASYTFMNMYMKGNRIGASRATDNEVYQTYMMAPESMSMNMHMAMLMYGVTDRLTLMGMAGFVTEHMDMNMDMNMPAMPGMTMNMGNMTMVSSSSGITDTRLSALYNVSRKEGQRIIASIGVNIPTGSIKTTGVTMLGENERLPYDMQPGTGCFSSTPGLTWIQQSGRFSFGADAGADIKLSYNSLGYKTGNIYHTTAWTGYRFLPFLSGSLRAEYVTTGRISGSDKAMDNIYYQQSDPTTKTANYGGTIGNVYAGLNFHATQSLLKNFQLLLEYCVPVYQDLNGTQMSLHSNLLAGVQYKF